jgi:nucleoside-diphosphate-sugar epimerase
VLRASEGCGLIIHGAAKVGAAGSWTDFQRINVEGTATVVEACQRQGVPALVHTSTPSVVFGGGDIEGGNESLPLSSSHHSAYTATKARAETIALEANQPGQLSVCAIRPHLVWGPGDRHILPRLVQRRRAGRLRRVGHGENIVDVTYVGDGARAHILAAIALLERRPKVAGNPFFISQGQPVKLWWMIDRMLESAGEPPVDKSISLRAASTVGGFLEWIHRILRLQGEPMMTRWVAAELATSHWFDITAARRDLGYEPTITVETGLEELRRWCQEFPDRLMDHG